MSITVPLEGAPGYAIRAAAAGLLLTYGSSAVAAPQDPSTYAVYVADQLAYDDNLYRLPSDADVTALAGPRARRQDVIDSVTLGADVHWYAGSQAVGVNVRVDDNRFLHNDALNNTSGRGNLAWDWRLGGDLSGQAGADYYRALASFANTNYYARDLVERVDYFGSARYRLGPHWALLGGVIEADTSLSAAAEQLYDFHSKSGNAGVEYASASGNTVTWEYRYTDARFPQAFELNGAPFNSNYNEDTALVSVKYAVTAATRIEASAGYLKRDYPYSGFATFSGNIWRASLQWQPTDEVQFVLTGWRELKAYVDAESDYFVSNGGSIAPAWTPSEKLTLSLAASWENHDYIGSSPSALTFVSRHDKVMTRQARLVYKPLQSLAVNLTYRYDRRDSNRARLEFDDTLATANVTFKFQL
jgi:exopolysaccharide biosynthesis operon protein EpsL